MKIPGFNADASLQCSSKTYRSWRRYGHRRSTDSRSGTLVPAIATCDTCPPGGEGWCLEYCTETECVYGPVGPSGLCGIF